MSHSLTTHWKTSALFLAWDNYEQSCCKLLYTGFVGHKFSFPWDKGPRLRHRVVVHLVLWESTLFQSGWTILHVHQQCVVF